MTLERISNHTANIADLAAIRAEGALLDVPSVLDGWRHAVAYWGSTMRGLVGSHHLRVDRVESCAARAVIPEAFRDKWQQLYSHDGVIVPVPYLYNQSVGTLLYMRIFAQLGINLRNLLHVQHQATRFGRVSGEYSPWHTTPRSAKLFGFKRPFLQGLGLRNALVRQLVLAGYPLTRFQMSFTTPAYLGQTVRLVMQGQQFEVVSEKGKVVSFGSANDET